jgi:hypothetical protein
MGQNVHRPYAQRAANQGSTGGAGAGPQTQAMDAARLINFSQEH